jgi:hypothetical protein
MLPSTPPPVTIQGKYQFSNGGICATILGYPAVIYNNDDACTISNVPQVPLQVIAFDTEVSDEGGFTLAFALTSLLSTLRSSAGLPARLV